MLRSPRFARASYVLFAVAVLAALMKLGSASGAEPFIMRMMPVTPVARANEPAVREVRVDEPLDLPEDELSTFVDNPLTGLTGRSEGRTATRPSSTGLSRDRRGERVVTPANRSAETSATFPVAAGLYSRCRRISSTPMRMPG